MRTGFLLSLLIMAIVVFPALFCGSDLQDPWTDPASSKIIDDRSLTGFPPAVNEFQTYPCSLYVLLPALSDSIRVVALATDGDIVLWQLGSLSAVDSAISLSVTIPAGAQSPIRAYLYRKNGTVDSMVKTMQVRRPPSAAPVTERYSTYVNVPVHPVFSITDPDGDIRSCQIWIDSTTGQAIVPPLTRTSATQATVTCAVTVPSFDTVEVLAQAVDSAGNGSAFARCTVFVMDTAKPRMTFMRLSPSSNDSVVNKVPCSLFVKIKDDSPIDSAVYAVNPFVKRPMTMINDTVALAVIAELDSGANFYEAQAWDRAGNKGTTMVHIFYTGTTVYQFIFSNIIDRTINEDGTFPSINLDSSITLNPPPVGNPDWKAAIAWQILETKPDSGIKPVLDPTTRVVTFAVPDSEWSGAESFTFIAAWNGIATGYAGAIYRINPINDPPVITWKGVTKLAKAANFDTILADKCVSDPDNAASTISWSQDTTFGHIYTLEWLSRLIIGSPATPAPSIPIERISLWNRRWAIVAKNAKWRPVTGTIYTDTLRVIARDPGALSDTQNVIIKATY
jgi:hypothetical protein